MSRKTRKLMWSVPLIAAVAVIGALAAFMTLTPNDASAQDPDIPTMVQNLTVEAHEDGVPQEELLITWEPPASSVRVTGYRIDVSLDGDAWVSYITDRSSTSRRIVYPNTQNPGIDTSLDAEETRHFRVFALNHEVTGAGTSDSGTTAESNIPDPPTSVTATVPTADVAIDLNGDGDTDDTLEDVSEAEVGLDLNGDGDLLDTNDTVSEANVFEDIDNDGAQTVIIVAWEAPDDPLGDDVNRYEVQRSSDGSNWRTLATVGDVGVFYDTGLRADAVWHYQVRAGNNTGNGLWSDSARGQTTPSPVPGEITAGAVSLNPAGTDVYLSWTTPFMPGDPVTHFRIQARDGDSTNDADFMPVHSGSRQIQVRDGSYSFSKDDVDDITGIDFPDVIPDDGFDIDVRIAAINSVNTNSADGTAAEVDWVLFDGIPVGHRSVPRKVLGLAAGRDNTQNEGRSGINLTWSAADYVDGSPVADQNDTQYRVVVNGTIQDAVGHAPALLLGGIPTKPGYDDNGLRTETARTYRVYAQNTGVTVTIGTAAAQPVRSIISGTVSRTTDHRIAPGAPTLTSAETGGHTEIELIWSRPSKSDDECTGDTDPSAVNGAFEDDGSECGSSVLVGYIIEYTDDNGETWTTHDDQPSAVGTIASPYVLGGLEQGTRYGVRIRATNERWESEEQSRTLYATTTEAGVPTPPGGLVAQADGQNTIKLCWYEQNVQKDSGRHDGPQ